MRAIVSEVEDSFVVSISTVSDENDIEPMAKETVERLGLAEIMIEKMATRLDFKMNYVDLMRNLSGGIFTNFSKS